MIGLYKILKTDGASLGKFLQLLAFYCQIIQITLLVRVLM